ncbi:hypothetical protein AB1K83_08825 [Sporosarcina sp. 179-K 3D1 HS]|uniref:hypothetical protein n=1 Tax=Sporosarcina sp. 179-K 3D1 HS TaxID=3232169 RepID=UPI0039A342AE
MQKKWSTSGIGLGNRCVRAGTIATGVSRRKLLRFFGYRIAGFKGVIAPTIGIIRRRSSV